MMRGLILFVICLEICLAYPPPPTINYAKSNNRRTSMMSEIAFPDDMKNTDFHHHHHHHYHNQYGPPEFPPDFQHNPRFHSKQPPNSLPPVVSSLLPSDNGDDEGEEEMIYRNTTNSIEIPLEYLQNLNNYNVSDLLLNYVDGVDEDESDSKTVLEDRFGEGSSEERSAAVMPKEAGCIPELTTVRLVENNDPSVLHIPQCTRIERCGGCCSHPLLSCQPTQTETVSFKVFKTRYTGAQKLKFEGKVLQLLERHTKCKCACKIQPKDCYPYQEYKESQCKCACINTDEEKKCYKNNSMKLWNPEICSCECRQVTTCSTGFVFDQNLCKCVVPQMKRRFASTFVDYPFQ